METLLAGTMNLLTNPHSLLILVVGVFFGQIFGAIPGLTAALGVSLLLPFTFAMTPVQGIALLIGIYVGGISGGLYAATLLNIPGNAFLPGYLLRRLSHGQEGTGRPGPEPRYFFIPLSAGSSASSPSC